MVRQRIIRPAFDEPALSPRELAVRFTGTRNAISCNRGFGLSPAEGAHDLIASPAFIVMKAADEVQGQDHGAQSALADRLHLSESHRLRGWFYLSTILDDFSRYIIAWKPCPTMKAEDVTATLDLALKASGLDETEVIHRPRLVSNHGSSYIAADLTEWLDQPEHGACPRRALSPHDARQDRALASDLEEPHPARELLPAGRSRSSNPELSSLTTITCDITRASAT